jgi:7-cyano-7-deazaguanine synthase
MHKVFCLLSGGVDSSTTLAIARQDFPESEIEAVTVNYGQRHRKEAECAAYQAGRYGALHAMMNVQGILTGMLVDKGEQDNEAIPNASYAELPEGISPTYVSFRNGFMLSLLAARAQSWVMERQKEWQENFDITLLRGDGADVGPQPSAEIYIGVHADDGVRWAYPDCSPEFIGAMANAIHVGTYFKVRLRAPLLFDDKPAVVRKGLDLKVNYANTWSCYVGGGVHCGVCPTCRSRKEAFDLNGATDPTEYAA